MLLENPTNIWRFMTCSVGDTRFELVTSTLSIFERLCIDKILAGKLNVFSLLFSVFCLQGMYFVYVWTLFGHFFEKRSYLCLIIGSDNTMTYNQVKEE
jgi:hypothetical protein